MIEVPEIREVSSPLTRKMLKRLDSRCQVVQFKSLPTDTDLERLGKFMELYPEVKLRAYAGYDGSITDLEFLRYFPHVRRFQADFRYHGLTNIDGLRYLPDNLEELSLGSTKRRHSLRPIARFTGLRTLSLESQDKDIEVVSELTALEDLTLRSITLPDLSLLAPLTRLWSLDVKLGGTRDLSVIPDLPALAYLELWAIRGVDDLAPVAQSRCIQFLFLQSLTNVDHLPDLSHMASLRRIRIEQLKHLDDLSPLLTAPALADIEVINASHLRPEHFQCLVGHPTLQSVTAGLGSASKNQAVVDLLALSRPRYPFEFRPAG